VSQEENCKIKNPSGCEVCSFRETNMLCSSDTEVWKYLDQVKQKIFFKPDQYIFYQDNEPLGLYILSSGLIGLQMDTAEGLTHTLRYIKPGSAFGYRSLFSNEKYSASAKTIQTSEVCFIPKSSVMTIFKNFPNMSIKLMQVLSQDLKLAEQKWTDQIDKDAQTRIAEAIVFLQENFSHQNWTRREIAEWAGTTPETVMRALSQFEKEGLIDQSEGRNIRILSKNLLLNR
jgi:CRP-like cAMP-binding protein